MVTFRPIIRWQFLLVAGVVLILIIGVPYYQAWQHERSKNWISWPEFTKKVEQGEFNRISVVGNEARAEYLPGTEAHSADVYVLLPDRSALEWLKDKSAPCRFDLSVRSRR